MKTYAKKQKNKKPQPKAKRDDFSSSVKKTMAERVAYLCSNPACRILTIGPHSKSDKVNRLGEAAHITAAIEGGERFDPNDPNRNAPRCCLLRPTRPPISHRNLREAR